MNETLTTDAEGRAVLRMERRLSHPPAKVWRALTGPAELSQWYPMPAIDIDLRVGGNIRFDLGADPNMPGTSTMDATITELDPPRAFAFSTPTGDVLENEGDNLLHFALQPDGDGCLLVFTHVFHDRPFAASNVTGWHGCLDAMVNVLDGRPVEWPESMVQLYEEYFDALGLAEGTADDVPAGWRVHFDRQLMQQPVDKVWASLAETSPRVGDPAPEAFVARDVDAGTVTSVEAPTLLEYEWRHEGRIAGRVRWELATTPPGARIGLTQTGPDKLVQERPGMLAAWQDHLEQLARRVNGQES